MGTCPFCRASISEELLRVGGRCPSCLIEIPGEEAATNPGEVAVAQQAAAEAASRRSPVPFIVGGIVALLVVIGGGVAYFASGDGEVEVVAADTEVYRKAGRHINLDADEGQEEAGSPSEAGKGPKAAKAKPTAAAKPDSSGGPEAAPPIRAEGDGVASADVAAVPSIGDPGEGQASSAILGATPASRSRGVQGLEGCGDSLAPTVRNAGSLLEKKLDRCYSEARGRLGEGVGATIRLNFTYETTGKLSNPSMSVTGSTDPAFQSCVRATVEGSTFTRICEQVDVEKTLRFGTGK